jgi:UDP-N-acetylmuramate dehydrogenase
MIQKNVSLGTFTSLKVGGRALFFAKLSSKNEIISLFSSYSGRCPVFFLGGGTNILVGDKGFNGLVIRNEYIKFSVVGKIKVSKIKERKVRNEQSVWREGILNWDNLEINQSKDGVLVAVSSGYPLPLLISNTLKLGFTGLELFSGIPGTVGGAVWNNIHGADWFFGDFIESVEVSDAFGKTHCLKSSELKMGYNRSYFQKEKLFIVSVTLRLFLGDSERAKKVSAEWVKRKSIQPKNSAGSTFSNITLQEKEKAGLDNLSAGYIIDKILNLRGFTVGRAKISERHANFIETEEGARASDVVTIIEHVKSETYEKLGISLKEEIVRVGEF